MSHRYLQSTWWVKRLFDPAERLVPAPWIMPVLAWAVRRSDEPELGLLADIVPVDCVAVDIGAADGVYTWCLSRLAGSCVAFEANPDSAERIKRRVPRATVHAVALSDSNGEARLHVPFVGETPYVGWATIHPENAFPALVPDTVRTVSVPTRTLDSFELQNVGFIKIDVEGHELAVLHGAANTVRRWRPIILVETEDQHNAGASARVQSWFEEAGYVASVATSGGFVKLSEKASAHNRNRLFRPIQRMYSGSISETTQDAEYNYNL